MSPKQLHRELKCTYVQCATDHALKPLGGVSHGRTPPPTTPDTAPGPVLHEDKLDYTPLPRSVPLARHRAARLVAEWGYPHLADDVALVASELVTNALLHGSLRDRLIRVRLAVTAAVLRVEVDDPGGKRLPCPRDAAGEEQFGRGLTIVAALADDWGTGPRTGVGKTVWAQWGLGLTLRGGDPLARTKE
ncbi:ATP-binding protein [Streptomyces kebangsaanensis]|uniref:ATP-binding protein n=1 Tax=Streptomyces kebangsaanensis TaxID=864058 RepID=UPI000ADFF508|nr:ATP-binding protein [Streptomyces kebangsaanensis]